MNRRHGLVLLLACAPLAAQRTIVVDAAQGAGFDFTDIPPAIDAAVDGDSIVVRAGSYTPFRIDGKAISVLGRPGAAVGSVTPAAAGVQVVSVTAGRDVVVSGLGISGSFLLGAFYVSNCSGRVLFADLDTVSNANVALSTQVMLNRCSFTRLQCFESTIALERCVGDQTGVASLTGSLSLQESSATCAQCTFIGASAALIFQATPGITLDQSTLRLAGDRASVVRAGAPNPTARIPAISGTGSLILDPDVTLQSAGGAPPITSTIQVETRDLPFLLATAGALGSPVSIEISASPDEAYFLFWSRAADRMPLPVFGAELWLDPSAIVQAQSGSLDKSGHAKLGFRAPRLPGLIGVPFYWQAVAGTPLALRLSNPSGYAHPPAPN